MASVTESVTESMRESIGVSIGISITEQLKQQILDKRLNRKHMWIEKQTLKTLMWFAVWVKKSRMVYNVNTASFNRITQEMTYV